MSLWKTLNDEGFWNSPIGLLLQDSTDESMLTTNPRAFEQEALKQKASKNALIAKYLGEGPPQSISFKDFVRSYPPFRASGYNLSQNRGRVPWGNTPEEIDYNPFFPIEPESMPTETMRHYEGRISLGARLKALISRIKNKGNR